MSDKRGVVLATINNYDKEEFARIQKAADKIKNDSDVLVVIGIGGSYLGARAAIEFLRHSFYNNLPKEVRKTPEIYYCGNSISSTYLQHLIDVIGDRDFGGDLRALLRGGADDARLRTAIRETIWSKPREHHFEDRCMPATRSMYRIGG